VQYPFRALQTSTEGWVEMSFTVAANGSVTNIKILNSTPPKVFEAAAIKAVSKLRYQPPLQNGRPAAVGTMIRVAFRLPK
jgi:protein TonB